LNHTLTVGDVIAVAAMLVGIVVFCFGVLEWFAGGQSPVPDAKMGRAGCVVTVIGVLIIAASVGVLRS
jgi:hypothetical protein